MLQNLLICSEQLEKKPSAALIKRTGQSEIAVKGAMHHASLFDPAGIRSPLTFPFSKCSGLWHGPLEGVVSLSPLVLFTWGGISKSQEGRRSYF